MTELGPKTVRQDTSNQLSKTITFHNVQNTESFNQNEVGQNSIVDKQFYSHVINNNSIVGNDVRQNSMQMPISDEQISRINLSHFKSLQQAPKNENRIKNFDLFKQQQNVSSPSSSATKPIFKTNLNQSEIIEEVAKILEQQEQITIHQLKQINKYNLNKREIQFRQMKMKNKKLISKSFFSESQSNRLQQPLSNQKIIPIKSFLDQKQQTANFNQFSGGFQINKIDSINLKNKSVMSRQGNSFDTVGDQLSNNYTYSIIQDQNCLVRTSQKQKRGQAIQQPGEEIAIISSTQNESEQIYENEDSTNHHLLLKEKISNESPIENFEKGFYNEFKDKKDSKTRIVHFNLSKMGKQKKLKAPDQIIPILAQNNEKYSPNPQKKIQNFDPRIYQQKRQATTAGVQLTSPRQEMRLKMAQDLISVQSNTQALSPNSGQTKYSEHVSNTYQYSRLSNYSPQKKQQNQYQELSKRFQQLQSIISKDKSEIVSIFPDQINLNQNFTKFHLNTGFPSAKATLQELSGNHQKTMLHPSLPKLSQPQQLIKQPYKRNKNFDDLNLANQLESDTKMILIQLETQTAKNLDAMKLKNTEVKSVSDIQQLSQLQFTKNSQNQIQKMQKKQEINRLFQEDNKTYNLKNKNGSRNQPHYNFKTNNDFNPWQKRKQVLLAMNAKLGSWAKSPHIISQKISPKNSDFIQELSSEKEQKTEGQAYESKQIQFNTENDHLFIVDKYLINVIPKVQNKKTEQDPQKSNQEQPGLKSNLTTSQNSQTNLLQNIQMSKQIQNLSDCEKQIFELCQFTEFDTFLKNLDQRFEKRMTDTYSEEPRNAKDKSDFQPNSLVIIREAQSLFKIIYQIDNINSNDTRYQNYVLNVFKNFPEDPLANSKVACALKSYLKLSIGGRYSSLKESECCNHSFDDDQELISRIRVMQRYLNFCKYLAYVTINREIQDREQDIAHEDDLDSLERKKQVLQQVKEQSQKIYFQLNKNQLRQNSQSTKKKTMAEKNILKNLKSYLEDPEISQEEKNLFIDVVSFKKLMQSPLVKLIAIERTNQILEDNNTEEPYKEESENEIMIKFDKNKELFLTSLANKVIKRFKKLIFKIKKVGNAIFQHQKPTQSELIYQELFTIDEQKQIQLKLNEIKDNLKYRQKLSPIHDQRDTSSNEEISVRCEESLEWTASLTNMRVQEKNLLQIKRVNYETPKIIDQEKEELDAQKKKSSLKIVHNMSDREIVKQICILINERQTLETIKAYDRAVANGNCTPNDFFKTYNQYKKKILQKKKSTLPTEGNSDPLVVIQDLQRDLPSDLKSNLYQFFKQKKQAEIFKINNKDELQYQYYNKAKFLSSISRNNQNINDDYHVKYFEKCQEQQILEIPLLFKNVQNQILFLKGINISLQQAKAIREILEQVGNANQRMKILKKEAQRKSSLNLDGNLLQKSTDIQKYQESTFNQEQLEEQNNPFIIQTLVIDDCNMSDDVFFEILSGILTQDNIRHIHYINWNHLGQKSCEVLKEICRRRANNFIIELNLSNLKIDPKPKGEELGYLVQISQEIETVCKIQRIKLSDVNLNDPEMTQNLIDILSSNYNITYLDLSNCNIQLIDLVRITSELQNCIRLDYFSIANNKINLNQILHTDVIFNLSKKNAFFGNLMKIIQKAGKGFIQQRIEIPKQVFQILIDQLSTNICEFFLMPAIQVSHVDLSGIGFDSLSIKKMAKALIKNVKIMSINFGNFQKQQDFATIRKAIEVFPGQGPVFSISSEDGVLIPNEAHEKIQEKLLKPPTISIKSNIQQIEDSIKELLEFEQKFDLSFKEIYVNSGLINDFKSERDLSQSMLMPKQSIQRGLNIQLIRPHLYNPELLLFNYDLKNQADIKPLDSLLKWELGDVCPYVARYKYTQIYFNQLDPSKNKLTKLIDKNSTKKNEYQAFVKYLERFLAQNVDIHRNYESRQQAHCDKRPIIIIDGVIYEMVNAVYYSLLLGINAIKTEQKTQLQTEPNGAVEITVHPPQQNMNDAAKERQQKYNKQIENIQFSDLVEHILHQSQEPIFTTKQLERQNEHQLRILKNFQEIHWQRWIDKFLLDNQSSNQTIQQVNPQDFKYQNQIAFYYDYVKSQAPKSKSSVLDVAEATIETSDKDGSFSQPNQQIIDGPIGIPQVYIYAGFLPPGVQKILIYDRQNGQVYMDKVLIQTAGGEEVRKGGDSMAKTLFQYEPHPLSQAIVQEIDENLACLGI